ncbi:hypothetical protein BDR04DRAFT_1110393 [Suillus decipiens]|nr:hypothetical protein BDR04DRAFT_1110393 [Suillus decipiens]
MVLSGEEWSSISVPSLRKYINGVLIICLLTTSSCWADLSMISVENEGRIAVAATGRLFELQLQVNHAGSSIAADPPIHPGEY